MLQNPRYASPTIVAVEEVEGETVTLISGPIGNLPEHVRTWLGRPGNAPDPYVPPLETEPVPSLDERLDATEKRLAAFEATAVENGVLTKSDIDDKVDAIIKAKM